MSFNIYRHRRLDEPKDAGWYPCEGGSSECRAATGCSFIPGPRVQDLKGSDGEDVDDDTYVYESDTGDEPYEYESDDDLVDSIMEDDASSSVVSDGSDLLYQLWLQDFIDWPGTRLPPKDVGPIPIEQDYASDSERRAGIKIWESCQHIAGPDCKYHLLETTFYPRKTSGGEFSRDTVLAKILRHYSNGLRFK